MTARILFVDDEPQILETMVGLWGGMYDVDTVLDGRAGLAAIARHEPDLIVSDLRMPGMDGAQFLAASRDVAPSAIRMLRPTSASPPAWSTRAASSGCSRSRVPRSATR